MQKRQDLFKEIRQEREKILLLYYVIVILLISLLLFYVTLLNITRAKGRVKYNKVYYSNKKEQFHLPDVVLDQRNNSIFFVVVEQKPSKEA